MRSSDSSLNSPSLHSSNLSSSRGLSNHASTTTRASTPSARVNTLRCGCTSASAGVMRPSRTSVSTSEWSSVSRVSSALANR